MTSASGGGRTRTAILCFDGSPHAVDALAYAVRVLQGWHVIVVCVWKRTVEVPLVAPAPQPVGHPAEANVRARTASHELAAQGAERAARAGLDAEALAVEADGPRWQAVEQVLEERGAQLVVCGTGYSGVAAVVPQSLAGALAAHATCPVLVVPSAEAAAERRRAIDQGRTSRTAIARAAASLAGRAAHQAARASPPPAGGS